MFEEMFKKTQGQKKPWICCYKSITCYSSSQITLWLLRDPNLLRQQSLSNSTHFGCYVPGALLSAYFLRLLDNSLNFGGNVCGKQLLIKNQAGGKWLVAMLFQKAPSTER